MSIVEPDTGELTVLLTKDEALALTAKIKSYAGVICQLVKEAHDKQAWRALGYGSWTAYTKAEFDISRSRSYQLIKYAEVAVGLAEVAQVPVEAITDALPEGSARNVTADTIDEVSTAVDTLGPEATDEERLDAAMERIAATAPSPAVLAARARREAEAAEPEQEPAPVPAPNTPDAEHTPARSGSTGGPAAPGALPGPDDAPSSAVSEPPAGEQPEPNQHSAPVATPPGWDWDVFLGMSIDQALKVITDSDELGFLDDVADHLYRFFQARKEMAA